VALGAFGAHALRERLEAESLEIFETGARYQMFHALALILSGVLCGNRRGRAVSAAGWLFVLGTLLFSGSLYALALTGVSILGAVTPLGGLAWLLAWALLALAALRRRTIEAPVEARVELVESFTGRRREEVSENEESAARGKS
jgi:uncharacterized membrane protein YgdD (TMEM256/DUF423 family)